MAGRHPWPRGPEASLGPVLRGPRGGVVPRRQGRQGQEEDAGGEGGAGGRHDRALLGSQPGQTP